MSNQTLSRSERKAKLLEKTMLLAEQLRPSDYKSSLVLQFIAFYDVSVEYTQENLLKFVKLMQEELDELKEAIEKEDYEGILDADVDLRYFLEQFTLISRNAKNLQLAFEDVHQANMTKHTDYVILRSDGSDGNPVGKILKPAGWKAPELKAYTYHQKFSDKD